MMYTFILIFTLSELVLLVFGTYNRSVLMQKYPDLGNNFIIFPHEHKGVKIGYLDPPGGPNRLFGLGSNLEDDVTFTLYTKDIPNGLKLTNYTSLPQNFDKSKSTKFITHGWMSSGQGDISISIKDAYLNKSDVNVFVVDWSPIADNLFYVLPMGRTKDVGGYFTRFLNYLVDDVGMDPKQLHLIGHSLGAHVSGFAGRGLHKGKVGRISGLDPALPGFDAGFMEAGRLNKDDADFVDIIHTCAGFLGLKQPIGHADFYPNGGTPPQPGCTLIEIVEACSHGRSWRLFSESITLEEPYMASRCSSFEYIFTRRCNGTQVPMGDPTPRGTEGLFYIQTTGEEPYLETN